MLLEPAMIQRFNPVLNGPWRPTRKNPYRRKGKRTTIMLTDPQFAALTLLSIRTGIQFSELVRRAIDDYLRWHQEMDIRYPHAHDSNPKETDHA